MKKLFHFLLVLAAGLSSVQAKTVTLGNEGITVDIPDDWVQADPDEAVSGSQGRLLLAHGGSYNVEILKTPDPRNVDLDSNIIADIKRVLQATATKHDAHMSFGDEGPLTIGGAPAYAINCTETGGLGTYQIAFYAVDANKAIYLVYLVNAGAASDNTLQTVIDSFHFLKPPSLPESTFHRRARKLIMYGGPVAVVVAAIGAGVWYFLRRRRQLTDPA
jgi:hypothetical protein